MKIVMKLATRNTSTSAVRMTTEIRSLCAPLSSIYGPLELGLHRFGKTVIKSRGERQGVYSACCYRDICYSREVSNTSREISYSFLLFFHLSMKISREQADFPPISREWASRIPHFFQPWLSVDLMACPDFASRDSALGWLYCMN